jgi:protocatechuate 3,4-dioxygenase beta subunit
MRTCISLLSVTFLVTSSTLAAQDAEFVRALERAQQQRPARVESTARIAPEAEPGTPLVIHGRVFAADGRTPLPRALVFAYHTDRTGLYDAAGSPAHSWRLRGWAAADADGRFEFSTIRPGAYPGNRIPAHVHFTIFTAAGERYHAGELQFEDDTLVPAADRSTSTARGDFGHVRPVRLEGGTQHVDVRLRVEARQKF